MFRASGLLIDFPLIGWRAHNRVSWLLIGRKWTSAVAQRPEGGRREERVWGGRGGGARGVGSVGGQVG